MSRLVLATLALALFALPGCDLLAASPSATVTVQKSDGSAPACCPMEGAGTVAADAVGDCSDCPTAAATEECTDGECQVDEACDMPECDMDECDMDAPSDCKKDDGSQQ